MPQFRLALGYRTEHRNSEPVVLAAGHDPIALQSAIDAAPGDFKRFELGVFQFARLGRRNPASPVSAEAPASAVSAPADPTPVEGPQTPAVEPAPSETTAESGPDLDALLDGDGEPEKPRKGRR